ncbi:hypothetical protein [Saccharothrix yanglingensis]|uniref:Condensation domain-containing protein n=1 Tax=Saccharothrix yanglingensis TaxID=659496 RepID=A0ABU0X9J7_9PSEU|nr:hypothetical protein [Saccharothrix yanglingensis]MDQ2588806.1 hypothetical protein [Saccharothrix yanglingensis]
MLRPSLAQQRLWFLDRFEDAGAIHNVQVVLRLRSELDRDALGATLRGTRSGFDLAAELPLRGSRVAEHSEGRPLPSSTLRATRSSSP